ncbi:hypothetical protein [Saccharothrix yanglingensis]|uniref:hypothetical protein n=1 Tax=Saccharothrix yanglingensis TaxID=659496 RepID=UPI0027D2120C|nr:hypothetical protein [Saccharothrix yanglingensis]
MRTDVGVRNVVRVRIESNSTIRHEVVAGEVRFEFAGGATELTFTEEALGKFAGEVDEALADIAAARGRTGSTRAASTLRATGS